MVNIHIYGTCCDKLSRERHIYLKGDSNSIAVKVVIAVKPMNLEFPKLVVFDLDYTL